MNPIQVASAIVTHGIISPLSHAIPIQVGIDMHAKVDLVDIQLAVNQQNLPTYRAYYLHLELTDSYRVRQTT